MSHASETIAGQRAGVLRRLAAIVYDALLLLAVLFVASALVLPLTHGKAVGANNPLFTTYLFFVTFFFFAWFWTHGGQTLGMRAWRIRVQLRNGGPIGWWHALLRFLTGLPAWLLLILGLAELAVRHDTDLPVLVQALYRLPPELVIGLGAVWLLWDHSPLSWRDRFSETNVVRVPKSTSERSEATER